MKLMVDLHIHSCLSPCAEMEMTPNNLVNMAWIKGLDVIAVADHNRALNLPACAQVAQERGLLLLPAIEVTCREEVHVLCYFSTLAQAQAFDSWLYDRVPTLQNQPDFFGEQCVLDAQDQLVAMEPRLLVQATQVSLAQVAAQAQALEGVVVPAHINRGANSLLGVLGFFPADVCFSTVEVDPRAKAPSQPLEAYNILRSSDAHRLEDIAEPGHALEVREHTMEGVLDAIRRKKADTTA